MIGPAPLHIEDSYLTIGAQRASASTKVRMMSLETTLKLKSKLVADTPVRLLETYESASSEPLGLFPVPMLPYKRPVLVSYLDETMLIVRDEAGRPDVLTRVGATVDAPDVDTPSLPQVVTEVEEKVEESVAGLETKVSETARDLVEAAQKAEQKAIDPVLAIYDKVALLELAGEERAAFFQQQADMMTERAAFFKKQQDDLDKRIAELEERQVSFGEAEARAFCQEKAEFFQQQANAMTEELASVLKEIEDTTQCLDELVRELVDGSVNVGSMTEAAQGLLHEQAADFQQEADAMTG